MFEYDTVNSQNRWVFRVRRLRKVSSDGADVTSGGRLFQTWGPATGKGLSPTVDRLDCGWMRRLMLAERRARRLGKSATRTNGPRYDGVQPWRTLYASTATLNWMRCRMRSQCRLISASDAWSERRKPGSATQRRSRPTADTVTGWQEGRSSAINIIVIGLVQVCLWKSLSLGVQLRNESN